MVIKNAEKLLKQLIPTPDGNIWLVSNVTVTMDEHIKYEFTLSVDVPVRSSAQQTYYSMTRRMDEVITLVLYKQTYELICYGQSWLGFLKDIDTMDKFIKLLQEKLPTIH